MIAIFIAVIATVALALWVGMKTPRTSFDSKIALYTDSLHDTPDSYLPSSDGSPTEELAPPPVVSNLDPCHRPKSQPVDPTELSQRLLALEKLQGVEDASSA
jgi:hypothetical protein